MTRREWLRLAALACFARALAQHGSAPRLALPTDPRHRVAIATYPFRSVIDAPGNQDRITAKPGMSLGAFARYVRREFNVFGIEPLHAHFPSTAPADIAALRREFDAAGVRTVNIPVDAPTDLCSADAQVRQNGFDTYRRWIDIAVQLSSPGIRIGSVPRCGDLHNALAVADALRPVVAYAASRGVIVTLENDDPVITSAARVTAILRAANNPWFRGLPDFGNGLLAGGERFNAEAVRQMFPFAATIAHVKDGETIKGKDVHVSLPALFAIAKESGFRGYYSMESDNSRDPAQNTHYLVEQTLALM